MTSALNDFFRWLLSGLLFIPFAACSQKAARPDCGMAERKTNGYTVLDSIPVLPYSIIQYNLRIKTGDLQTKGFSFLTFYDSVNRELLSYESGPVSSISYQSSGNYTEAPPFTSYARIGTVTDSSGAGYLFSDSLDVKLNVGRATVQKMPLCNLDEYMKPFWNSDTIYNETVLMYSVSGNPASGRLLYMPDKIISVRRFDLSGEYHEGSDYMVQENEITRSGTSDMPFTADAFFDRVHDLSWYDLQSKWVVVTYTHHDKWNGPVPVFKGTNLPSTLSRLRARLPVKIIAFGMSITRGLDVSSYDDVAPYMPTYLDLFARQLRKNYNYDGVEMINAGLPGALVSWGAAYAEKYINPVHPDLVIIDFGMNDFWRYTPAEFKGYIQTILDKVKKGNPAAEFLLISNMDFDPDYILNSDKNKNFYVSNMQGYKDVLREMENTGIVNLDMTTLSDAIYLRKKPKDCIANPLHPNDYLARWYAQGLTSLVSQ